MASNKKAEKKAEEAAEASRLEAERLRVEAELKKEKEMKEKDKANRLLARSQRARGGGFFESDNSSTLG